ncbi:hypothetical protein DEU56DRAFT_275835 [Suillus clintonianus]|uniref:uncharacterized protein n=1 Tax=Suillus clintonianus TaxID=1904413 RepID=UPI001B85E481|nr:uncharacterized protein DEU56DRAFT_275835 [Suillus clintonianus]KAG2141294.1 hypothetical protein DEU56DRAFT_275835 [Suillus clintonianus]
MTLSASLDVIPRSRIALAEESGAYIDEDMAASAKSLHTLRSHNNPFISCLPPEILVDIFTYTVEETCNSLGAMIATHVCRHWRQVALECPTLWTYIDCVRARWLAILLERSKGAALIVIYSLPHVLERCAEQILSQLPRIKVLRLCSFSFDADRIVDCLSSQPAPFLQKFRLGVIDGPHPHITDTIFQGQAPQLRSVELFQCIFSWTLFIFSGLRTLDVRRVGFASCPTLLQLLSALKRMPGLEQLTLDLLPQSENTQLFHEVSLARLKSIALHGLTIHTAISLFSHLLLPGDVKITLDLAPPESPESFHDLFSAMYKDPDKSLPVIQAMRAEFAYGLFDLQFSTSTAFKSEYFWDPCHGDIPLSIKFQCQEFSIEPTIVFDVCRIVPHRKIQHLFVSSRSLDPLEHFWRTGSTVLPELESMHLSVSTPIGSFIDALQSGDMQGSDIAYPSLRDLRFDHLSFGCDEPGYLQAILMMRAERGVGINKLQLEMCRNLTGDKVQLLRDVVADVDWDGHEEDLLNGGWGCTCVSCTVLNWDSIIPVDSTSI